MMRSKQIESRTMSLTRDRDNKRLHIKSKLMGESLVSKEFNSNLEIPDQRKLFPDLNIMKIGGQSICDRKKNGLPAIINEIAANRNAYKMLLTTGGGTRSRHILIMSITISLLP